MSKDPMTESGRQLALVAQLAKDALAASDADNRHLALLTLLDLEAHAALARRALVSERRVMGASWPDLADALGISKQGAAKVYGEASEQLLSAERRHFREQLQAEQTTPVVAGQQLVQLVRNDAGQQLLAPSSPVAAPAVDVPLDVLPVRPFVSGDQLVLHLDGWLHLVTGGPRADALQGDDRNPWADECQLCDAVPGEGCTNSAGEPVQPELEKDGTWHVWTHATRRGFQDPEWAWKRRGKQLPAPTTGVFAVTCPSCGAEPGNVCRQPNGGTTRGGKSHAPRAQLAGIPSS